MPAVIACLQRRCLREIIKRKSKEDALVTIRRVREHLNYYLILSVSIQIKDTPLVIACIGSIRATCDKCTFMIKLKLYRIALHRVLILKNSPLVVLSPNSEGFLPNPSGPRFLTITVPQMTQLLLIRYRTLTLTKLY